VANGDVSSVRVLASPTHPAFHSNALGLLPMRCPDSVSGERSAGHSRIDRFQSLRRISSEEAPTVVSHRRDRLPGNKGVEEKEED